MKPQVKFSTFLGWRNHPRGAVQALLTGVVGHPYCGAELVTSAVVKIEYTPDHTPSMIETLNTIYQLER